VDDFFGGSLLLLNKCVRVGVLVRDGLHVCVVLSVINRVLLITIILINLCLPVPTVRLFLPITIPVVKLVINFFHKQFAFLFKLKFLQWSEFLWFL
jgi:hypothetical protein